MIEPMIVGPMEMLIRLALGALFGGIIGGEINDL